MPDTLDPLTPPRESHDFGRRQSSPVLPSTVFGSLNASALPSSNGTPRHGLLSPPLTPRGPNKGRPAKLSLRLRSNSGMSFHTNEDALRQYTDYYPDGSPRAPLFAPVVWQASMEGKGDAASSSVDGNYRRSMGPASVGYTNGLDNDRPLPRLPIPDFFSREVFHSVLNNPTTCHRLYKFAQSQGCEESIEYLIKLREYSGSVRQLTANMSTIASTFTSLGATSPINLPSTMSKAINNDIKHVTASILPGLDTIFLESKTFIERRIAREIYPAFVKSQVALCISLAFSTESGGHFADDGPTPPPSLSSFYPGLGDAFCLTDPLIADNPIVSASDGFIAVTGYSRHEIIPRNCRFLQGPQTDPEVSKRMGQAIAKKRESVELLLNYRSDGQPFWNLVFVCPLFESSGRLRYFLGGQINISETIGDHKDVLRILNCGPAPHIMAIAREDSGIDLQDDRPSTHRQGSRGERESERDKSGLRARGSVRSKSSRKSFFKPFRKQPSSSPLGSPESSLESSQCASDFPSPNGSATNIGLEQSLNSRSAAQKLSLSTQIESFHSAYSRFMVLRVSGLSGRLPLLNSHSSTSLHKTSSYHSKKGIDSQRLDIAFCSQAALDVLGLGMAADAVAGQDIFGVLAEQASSPSVTKGFKTAVRERVLHEGRSVTLDLAVSRGPLSATRKSSIAGLVARANEDAERGRGKEKERKLAKNPTSRPVSSSRMERLLSYWTPLKDEDGGVQWVVLVLTPTL